MSAIDPCSAWASWPSPSSLATSSKDNTMNKIETAMVASLKGKAAWTQTNTTVWHDNTCAALVTIYGHPIARQMADGSWLFTIVSDHLALSRSRINAIARAHGLACVFAHKGRTMFFIPDKALSEAPLDYWFALPKERA